MLSKSIGLLFMGFLSSLALNASADANADIGQHWPKIIAGLKQRGIEKIGDLDLDQFVKESEQISWSGIPSLPPEELTGNRRSAHYIRAAKKVFISPGLARQPEEAQSALELHEAMGALGYNDGNYILSSSLGILLRVKDEFQLAKLRTMYGERIFKKDLMKLAGGGGSSVGGGGDTNAVVLKNEVVSSIINSGQGVTMDFLTLFPTINFEPVYQSGVDFVSMTYQFRDQATVKQLGSIPGTLPKVRGEEELVTVLFPVKRWNGSSKDRQLLIADIKQKILGIFPSSVRSNAASVQHSGCESSVTVDFPLALDPTVREVQKIRTSLIRGCKMGTAGDIKFHFPALPTGAAPEAAGKVFYFCKWAVGQTRGHEDFVADSEAGSFMTMASLANGSSIIFGLQTDLNKGIESLVAKYPLASGQRSGAVQRGNGERSARLTFTIDGVPGSFECASRALRDSKISQSEDRL